jgi:hypothetical protein
MVGSVGSSSRSWGCFLGYVPGRAGSLNWGPFYGVLSNKMIACVVTPVTLKPAAKDALAHRGGAMRTMVANSAIAILCVML